MCAEASTVLRAVVADFFFNCWHLEIQHTLKKEHDAQQDESALRDPQIQRHEYHGST
jgi:hypothetical protein